MAQHAILRFEKHKGHPAGPLEAHHERKKEQYASNPDIDTSRSKYNFHIVKPDGRYYHFIQRPHRAGQMPHPQGQHSVCGHADYRQPGVFQGQVPKEIAAYFQRAADFLIDRVGRENIVSAMVHMDEKTPHLHLVFVPLTKDNRLCAKEISATGPIDEVAGRFSRLYGGAVPRPGAWGKRQQDGPEAYPHPAVQTGGQPLQTGEGH